MEVANPATAATLGVLGLAETKGSYALILQGVSHPDQAMDHDYPTSSRKTAASATWG